MNLSWEHFFTSGLLYAYLNSIVSYDYAFWGIETHHCTGNSQICIFWKYAMYSMEKLYHCLLICFIRHYAYYYLSLPLSFLPSFIPSTHPSSLPTSPFLFSSPYLSLHLSYFKCFSMTIITLIILCREVGTGPLGSLCNPFPSWLNHELDSLFFFENCFFSVENNPKRKGGGERQGREGWGGWSHNWSWNNVENTILTCELSNSIKI